MNPADDKELPDPKAETESAEFQQQDGLPINTTPGPSGTPSVDRSDESASVSDDSNSDVKSGGQSPSSSPGPMPDQESGKASTRDADTLAEAAATQAPTADPVPPVRWRRNFFTTAQGHGSGGRKFAASSGLSKSRLIVSETLERNRDLFHYPPAYRAFRETEQSQQGFAPSRQIILIEGHRNTGRYSCALNIAIALTERRDGESCFLVDSQQSSLEDFLNQSKDLHPGGVYIARESLGHHLASGDVNGELLDIVSKQLKSFDAFLIVTTPVLGDARSELSQHLLVLELPPVSEQPFLAGVIDSYLKYHKERAEIEGSTNRWKRLTVALDAVGEEVAGDLHNPVQVNALFLRVRHCHQLPGNTVELQQWLIETARQIGQRDRVRIRDWFRGLTMNQKLFAMLVTLFDGVTHHDIHDLYSNAVQQLLPLELEGLHDDRQLGTEELYESLHLALDLDSQTLEFTGPDFADEIDQQIESYRRLLWTALTNTIAEWAVAFVGHDQEHPRRCLGRVLGRLGLRDRDRLYRLLDQFARHRDGAVASIAGYALQYIVGRGGRDRDVDTTNTIDEKLGEWIHSRDPNCMWTAAFAIGSIYAELIPHPNATTDSTWEGSADQLRGRCESRLAQLAASIYEFDPPKYEYIVVDEDVNDEEDPIDDAIDPHNGEIDANLISPADWERISQQYRSEIVVGVANAIQEIYDLGPRYAVDLLSQWMQSGGKEEEEQADGHGEQSEVVGLAGVNEKSDSGSTSSVEDCEQKDEGVQQEDVEQDEDDQNLNSGFGR
ncbi:MAG: hypothetical protein AAFP90_12795, partial [Planctomycetota bacterium]